MQGLNLLGLAFLLCVLDSAAVGQDGMSVSPTEPSLRKSQTIERRKELPTRNFVIVDLSPKKILENYPEIKGYAPSPSQDELAGLLAKVGANQDTFLRSLPNLASQEDVVHERLDSHGWVQGLPISTGHYSYLVRAHVTGEGIRFSEGRTDANWRRIEAPPVDGFSLTQDFALYPLQFHPFHQGSAKFRYLGRQLLDNRQDYVIAFAQEPEKSDLIGVVTVNGRDYQVAYQGLAWIEPDSFQIVRMRIDLLKPRPEVASQVTDLQLGEVRLPLVAKPLWLPREVVVTRPTKGGALRETHRLTDYRVFTSEAKTVPTAQLPAEKPK